jgi:hypothetical protein
MIPQVKDFLKKHSYILTANILTESNIIVITLPNGNQNTIKFTEKSLLLNDAPILRLKKLAYPAYIVAYLYKISASIAYNYSAIDFMLNNDSISEAEFFKHLSLTLKDEELQFARPLTD